MRIQPMICFAAALAAAMAGMAAPAGAQQLNWPTQPVRIVVPQAPGGGTDAFARILSERLQTVLGQPFIVENKTGAGGNIGTEFVARQRDGHTFLLTTSTHVTNISFFSKLPYDPVKDFAPVSLIGSVPFVMSVNAASPVKTVKELIDLARAKPGTVTYASSGIGTPQHLGAELLKSKAGIDMTHIPYKGSSPAVMALLSNEVSVSISAVSAMLPHIRSGKLRPLGTLSATRTQFLPNVPTIAESAGLPDYAIDSWYGVLAPAGTPRAVIERMNVEINKIVRDPQLIKEKLNGLGIDAVGSTPDRFAEVIKSDLLKYPKIARDANIVPE
jgi:tripartite-type tricarboxylate transporter receptor subunit TctC